MIDIHWFPFDEERGEESICPFTSSNCSSFSFLPTRPLERDKHLCCCPCSCCVLVVGAVCTNKWLWKSKDHQDSQAHLGQEAPLRRWTSSHHLYASRWSDCALNEAILSGFLALFIKSSISIHMHQLSMQSGRPNHLLQGDFYLIFEQSEWWASKRKWRTSAACVIFVYLFSPSSLASPCPKKWASAPNLSNSNSNSSNNNNHSLPDPWSWLSSFIYLCCTVLCFAIN